MRAISPRCSFATFVLLAVCHADLSADASSVPSIGLHIETGADLSSDPCAPELVDSLGCGMYVIEGDNSTTQRVYIVIAGADSLRGAAFGVVFPPSANVRAWHYCTDAGTDAFGFPASTGSAFFDWTPAVAMNARGGFVIGAFDVDVGARGYIEVTDHAFGVAEVTDVAHGPRFVATANLGLVDLAGDYPFQIDACPATPVIGTTWGRVKAIHRRSETHRR